MPFCWLAGWLVQGTLVVTEECLLHPSRNPHYGKANIERVLKEYLGLEKVSELQLATYSAAS